MSVETKTAVVLPDPSTAFRELVAHVAEHGIDHDRISSNRVQFRHEECVLDFSHNAQELHVHLTAPNENMIFFLKEAAAAHIVEIDPVAGESLVWSGADTVSGVGGHPINFRVLTLVKRRDVFPGMTRLTLSGEDVSTLADDGLHVKLMRPALDEGDTPQWPTVAANGMTVWPQGADKLHVRYFTLRHVRRDAGEVDIDVVQHPGGMISDWAAGAVPGDVIGVMGPGGGSIPDVPGSLLLAGDETALPAIARIMEKLPADQQGTAIVAVPNEATLKAYFPKTNLRLIRLPSDQFRTECLNTTKDLIADGTKPAFAWFAGEFSNANAMRKLFKNELGLAKGNQLSVAYWEDGKRGDAARVD